MRSFLILILFAIACPTIAQDKLPPGLSKALEKHCPTKDKIPFTIQKWFVHDLTNNVEPDYLVAYRWTTEKQANLLDSEIDLLKYVLPNYGTTILVNPSLLDHDFWKTVWSVLDYKALELNWNKQQGVFELGRRIRKWGNGQQGWKSINSIYRTFKICKKLLTPSALFKR